MSAKLRLHIVCPLIGLLAAALFVLGTWTYAEGCYLLSDTIWMLGGLILVADIVYAFTLVMRLWNAHKLPRRDFSE